MNASQTLYSILVNSLLLLSYFVGTLTKIFGQALRSIIMLLWFYSWDILEATVEILKRWTVQNNDLSVRTELSTWEFKNNDTNLFDDATFCCCS